MLDVATSLGDVYSDKLRLLKSNGQNQLKDRNCLQQISHIEFDDSSFGNHGYFLLVNGAQARFPWLSAGTEKFMYNP